MIYTKNGDQGKSSVINGFPTTKDAPIFQVLGTIDELSSSLGIAKSESYGTIRDTIELIKKELINVGTSVAGGKEFDFVSGTENFETLINAFENKNKSRNGFSISGETKVGASIDFSRSISRRLERNIVYMTKNFNMKKEVNPYFNRLSDLLYVLARYADMVMMNVDKSNEKASMDVSNISDSKNEAVLNSKAAVEICQRVLQKAREQGLRAVCSVCNKEGNLLAIIRDDDSFVASTEIARKKAWTSISLKMSTKEALELTENKDGLYGLQYLNDNNLILLAGGQPLKINNEIVGGIGVSGGLAWQDEELSIYGKEFFERGVKV